jgi:hypothetical protein
MAIISENVLNIMRNQYIYGAGEMAAYNVS